MPLQLTGVALISPYKPLSGQSGCTSEALFALGAKVNSNTKLTESLRIDIIGCRILE